MSYNSASNRAKWERALGRASNTSEQPGRSQSSYTVEKGWAWGALRRQFRRHKSACAPSAPTPHDWMDDSACRATDPDLFFSTRRADITRAKEICRGCPVITLCLRAALSDPHLDGVWGGTTPDERLAFHPAAAERN